MIITHHGGQCFKVTLGDLTLVFDPISKKASLPSVRFGADIAIVSRNHADMNGIDEVTFGGKTPFAITGPGEYERAGVTVQGFLSSSNYGLEKGQESATNTIYALELEDMTLVHLGALSDKELPNVAREGIDKIDVLFVPIGGSSDGDTPEGVLSASEGYELAVSLQPKIIIPMHWSGIGADKSLDTFLSKSGNGSEKLDKLTLKKRDLAGKEGAIIVVTT